MMSEQLVISAMKRVRAF